MNILFDLITPQGFIGGAGEYVRKVFYTLLDFLKKEPSINLFVAIDSSLKNYAYKDLTPDSLLKMPVQIINLGAQTLSNAVLENRIDTVFIGMAQAWGGRYDVQNLRCRVVCVVHDINDYEYRNTQLNWYLRLYEPWVFCKKIVRRLLGMDNYITRLDNVIELYNTNPITEIVTVSYFSKYSMEYLLGLDSTRMHVLYSPERIGISSEEIENELLRELIHNKKKYYLFVSANRPMKNARKVLSAFERYVKLYEKEAYIVTTGKLNKKFPHHIVLPYLSDSDLMNAYKYCYAFIFASFFEGFGYPPLEAMRFGKPVLASNVTSIPEVLGNAALFFSPLFESDIFRCLVSLNDKNYDVYAANSKERYSEISAIQYEDLNKLIEVIVK